MSGNGLLVAFESGAADLVTGDTNGFTDIFLLDCGSGTTIRVSQIAEVVGPNGRSHAPVLSADGRLVLFLSDAANILLPATNNTAGNGAFNLYFFNVAGNTIERLNVTTLGEQVFGTIDSPALDIDGSVSVRVK